MPPFAKTPLAALLDPVDPWEARRRPPRHCDEALTGTTRRWLLRLPAGRRPEHTCMQYPRVANQIAWAWPDRAATLALLDELLSDRRGGRAGFPRPVAQELRRLRELAERGTGPAAGHNAADGGALGLLRRVFSGH